MLYGVRADLQAALAREGYGVRAYVPWGSRWYEYVLGCARRVPGGALRRVGERLRRAHDEESLRPAPQAGPSPEGGS